MVSNFITEHDGLLMLSNSKLEIARLENMTINQEARELLNYSAAGQGYWTGERFLAQVTSAMAITEFKYPEDLNTLVWLFDQSSCHCAHKDALNVKRINVKPGGVQPDTKYNGISDGTPKGMKLVLEERKVDTSNMKVS